MPAPTQQSAPGVAVTPENFTDVAGLWQGGQGTRTETSRCPACGGDHYFSRRNSGQQVPAHCYSCGYTEGRPMQGIPSA